MKQLMFAVAAVAAGVACADIVSANIVGYAQSALDTNYGAVMTGSQFIKCGGTGSMALASMTPKAASMSAEELAGSVEIQTLDSHGYTAGSYVWNGEGWEGDDSTEFAAGTGLWVINSVGASDTVGLQSAGQVSTSDVVVTLDKNYGAVAVVNAFPVKVALASIDPESASMSAEELAGSVEIQTLDSHGYTAGSYVWNGEGWEGDDSTEFNAGEGLWVINSVGAAADVSLRIPAPEL